MVFTILTVASYCSYTAHLKDDLKVCAMPRLPCDRQIRKISSSPCHDLLKPDVFRKVSPHETWHEHASVGLPRY